LFGEACRILTLGSTHVELRIIVYDEWHSEYVSKFLIREDMVMKSRWSMVRIVSLSLSLALVMLATIGLALQSTSKAQATAAGALTAGVRVVRADQDGVVLDVTVPTYTVEKVVVASGTFQRLQVDGLEQLTQPDLPQLPKAVALIGIPPEAQISVHILQDDAIPVRDRWRLLLAPSPLPAQDEAQPGRWQSSDNSELLTGLSIYPARPMRIVETAWMRDQQLARLEVYPFQYQPASASLVWHRHLVVEVRFEKTGQTDRALAEARALVTATVPDASFEAILSRTLVNYEVARAWRGTPATASRAAAFSLQSPWTEPRYRIGVNQDGLYRITYADLQAAGFITSSIDPRHFHMTNQGSTVALQVSGEADGQFNSGDFILFYGQKLRGDKLAAQYASEGDNYLTYPDTCWKAEFNAFMVERYTNENVYWLTVETTPGLRITTVNGTPGGSAPQAAYYTATVRAEQSHRWRTFTMTGEDPFFWEFVSVGDPANVATSTFTTTLTALSGSVYSATVRGEVVATTSSSGVNPDHHTRFVWNNAAVPLEDSTWDGPRRHRFTGQVASADLHEGTNDLNLGLERVTGLNGDTLLFDWFELDYRRRLQAENDQLIFTGDQIGARRYQVGNLSSSSVYIYDVSDPLAPRRVLSPAVTSNSGVYTASFEVTHTQPVTYFVASAAAIRLPKTVTKYAPSIDLTSPANRADYIMITPRAFVTTVQRLADYREAQGLRVQIVDLDDVFNQFTDGIYHPIAIKAFLQHAYEQWQQPAPQYVLLVGDGHSNFNAYSITTKWNTVPPFTPIYMPPNLSWVDPWQGEVDSANLLATVAGADLLPEMFIGRMPVSSAEELNRIISKTIAYESAPSQDWQRRLTFIADSTPDSAGDFVALSEEAIHSYAPPGFAADRIYEDDFGCTNVVPCPAVNYAITNTLNQTGALLLNYVGHGSTYRWSHESILVGADLSSVTNLDRLPVILSWTCLDGFWSHFDTQIESGLMEGMLRSPNGGAVATFSPTGLGVATGHDALQRGFYRAVFEDGVQRLGPATLAAKLELYAAGHDYDLLNTFTILGDPALRLPTYALSISPSQAGQIALSDSTAVYTLRVTNTAFLTDTPAIDITGTWPMSVSVNSVVLPPGASSSLMITVAVPPTVTNGALDTITVTLQSQGVATRVQAMLTTTALVAISHVYLPLVRK
jgi:hypothetical protein